MKGAIRFRRRPLACLLSTSLTRARTHPSPLPDFDDESLFPDDDGEGGTGVDPQGDDSLIVLHVSGTGFLKHMVRRLVGTLRQIGEASRPPSDMAAVLLGGGGDQGKGSMAAEKAGPAAPARGLLLTRTRMADEDERQGGGGTGCGGVIEPH